MMVGRSSVLSIMKKKKDCFVFSVPVSVGFALMLRNPLGYVFSVNDVGFHNLTFLLLSVLLFWFWNLMTKTPFLQRFFLSSLLCFIGYENYDFFWQLDCLTTYRMAPSLRFLPHFILLLFPLGLFVLVQRKKRGWNVPVIRYKRYAVVLFINLVCILWLESTGFFPKIIHYWIAKEMRWYVEDPHNVEWAIGKTVGMMSWVFAIRRVDNDIGEIT